MVAVGSTPDRGRSRLVVWFDDRGIAVSASLDQYDPGTHDLAGCIVTAVEPFESLPDIYGRLVAESSAQLELPL